MRTNSGVRGGGFAWLILIASNTIRAWGDSDASKIWVQLDRTVGRRARKTERLFFLYAYLGPSLPSAKQRRFWLEKLRSVRRRKDREYAKRKTASHGVYSQRTDTRRSPAPRLMLYCLL